MGYNMLDDFSILLRLGQLRIVNVTNFTMALIVFTDCSSGKKPESFEATLEPHQNEKIRGNDLLSMKSWLFDMGVSKNRGTPK